MPPPATLLRAARPAFRQQQAHLFTQNITRSTFRNGGRRFQSTAAAPEGTAQQVGWIKRMWDSPIGLKTVHFWAPVMKWAIVLAGVSDFARPVEKLSLTQNVALTATGLIWTRWCLIIKPRNVLLASVNFCLGIVGVIQVSRIINYNYFTKKETTGQQIEEAKGDLKSVAGELKGKVEDAVKQ